MKIVFTVLCLLMVTAAFGQSSVGAGAISSEARPLSMPNHARVATVQPLATPRDLLGGSTSSSARGELPLWRFAAPRSNPVSLGEVARQVRQEKAVAKKATFVREN
jgi:hypothetical protein